MEVVEKQRQVINAMKVGFDSNIGYKDGGEQQ